MQIFPVHTPLIRTGDNIAMILRESGMIVDGDIVVLSSKAVATAERTIIDLSRLQPSAAAESWSVKTGKSATFCEAVLMETLRMHGRVLGSAAGALLTEVKPDGLPQGVILAPNAGLDQSNIDDGFAVGWPTDPVTSAHAIRSALAKNVAVIIGDSCIRPRRIGVTAFALAVCGIDPLRSDIGRKDLFGHPLRVTVEAVADQLTVAANAVMGNADQSCPAAIIRDHGIPFTEFCGWVPGIEPEEDLFKGII